MSLQYNAPWSLAGYRANISRKGSASADKGEINIVTDVDIACQQKIIELIEKNFPDDCIIAEEKSNIFDEKRNKWIVDPL